MTQNSWPFKEAQKLLDRVGDKEEVVFETGFGPSGLPHIGTFGEVVRTTMVMNAFRQLSDKPTRLIVFSDDMDAFRKVPENVPNQEMLEKHLGRTLSSVPNPFDTEYESFSAHNNAKLCEFLDDYGFEYEFLSSTECYRSGMFNDILTIISQRSTEIAKIVTHDYGQDRKDTYCPFIPIKNGIHYFELQEWHTSDWYLNWKIADDSDKMLQSCIITGPVKCQWKVDWPMRWIALGIDYEMHGKDLRGSAQVGQRICRLLNRPAPMNFEYELFLERDGKKISKTIGNGMELDEWWHYSTQESLSYYMFQNPRKARRLSFSVVPKMTDDYIKSLRKYQETPDMDNAVWHIHSGNVPTEECPLNFSMLLNLVSVTNTNDRKVLWGFIRNYKKNVSPQNNPLLDGLVSRAINYYESHVLPFKQYRSPNVETMELPMLMSLKAAIAGVQMQHKTAKENGVDFTPYGGEDAFLEEALTTAIYDNGKVYYGETNLRAYFQAVYEIVMGQSSGPRLPVFVMIYGIENTIQLLSDIITKEELDI